MIGSDPVVATWNNAVWPSVTVFGAGCEVIVTQRAVDAKTPAQMARLRKKAFSFIGSILAGALLGWKCLARTHRPDALRNLERLHLRSGIVPTWTNNPAFCIDVAPIPTGVAWPDLGALRRRTCGTTAGSLRAAVRFRSTRGAA